MAIQKEYLEDWQAHQKLKKAGKTKANFMTYDNWKKWSSRYKDPGKTEAKTKYKRKTAKDAPETGSKQHREGMGTLAPGLKRDIDKMRDSNKKR